jgi:hypothetical protein
MTKAKKPISAAVTATIAIKREAPSPFKKSSTLCKQLPPRFGAKIDWANIA